MAHTSIDIADRMAFEDNSVSVESINIAMHPVCWNIVDERQPNKIRPVNIVDAQFSNYVQITIALLHALRLAGRHIRRSATLMCRPPRHE